MTRQQKLWWMFTPLVLLGLVWAVLLFELQNAQLDTREGCTVVQISETTQKINAMPQVRWLYQNGSRPQDNMVLQCTGANADTGLLAVNDPDLTQAAKGRVQPGMHVVLRHVQYRFLPESWRVLVTLDEEEGKADG